MTFASSETEQNVSVSVVNDNTLESTETFTAMLVAIPGSIVTIGAGGIATATITDDDSKSSFSSMLTNHTIQHAVNGTYAIHQFM